MKRNTAIFGTLLLLLTLILPTAAVSAQSFPETIPLPNGWQPEGIVTGYGSTIYAGSLANGAIYEANLRSGEGEEVVAGEEGRVTVGLSFDPRSGGIFAAGGPSGLGYVFDADTGETLGEFEFTTEQSFVNDVVVTRAAAYFTDSARPFIYRVPLGPSGVLPDPSEVEAIELSSDYEQVEGFNVNGIDATPGGKALIVVQTATGKLFKVDPATGEALEIDLGGETLPNGDGILLRGKTLYVVQNQLNQVAVVQLANDYLSGEITETITNEAFRVPTTIAAFGSRLYVVNARFGTEPTPDTEYEIVQVVQE